MMSIVVSTHLLLDRMSTRSLEKNVNWFYDSWSRSYEILFSSMDFHDQSFGYIVCVCYIKQKIFLQQI